jgi:hypothetical protein
LRFGLSYRDVEELLTERGIQADNVTIYRRVQRFTPLLAKAARPCRHAVGDRWQVDETYVKVGGQWRYVSEAGPLSTPVQRRPKRPGEPGNLFFIPEETEPAEHHGESPEPGDQPGEHQGESP